MITIILQGNCPSKKNLYRRKSGGGFYLDEAVRAQIDALSWQAITQRPQVPLVHPDMTVEFYVQNEQSDRDGKLATVLDCLQVGKVIKNDNIASFNGTLTILPAKLSVREKVIVTIL